MENKATDEKNEENNNVIESSPRHASSEPPNTAISQQQDDDEHCVHEDSAIEGGELDTTKDQTPTCHLTLAQLSADVDSWIGEIMQQQQNVDIIEIPDCVDKFLGRVQENIVSYDVVAEGKPEWVEAIDQASSFLEYVNLFTRLFKMLSQSEQIREQKDSMVKRMSVMQQGVMLYLEEVFRMVVEGYCYNKGESDDQRVENDEFLDDFPGYSEETITIMNMIAREMILCGYESECCQVYIISRRNAFEEKLEESGFNKISVDEIQKMSWELLEKEIPSWIEACKGCVCNYFPKELKLMKSVFEEHPMGMGLYSNLTRGVVIQLLNFVEGVAMTKCSIEKIFKLLDMCETLGVVISGLNHPVLMKELGTELTTETTLARNRLGEAVVSIFFDLENSIKAESGKDVVAGGDIHPMTKYVMNYLSFTCAYKDTLEQIFKEHMKLSQGDVDLEGESRDKDEGNVDSPFAEQVVGLMESLDTSLEGKAKLYKDVSLGYIFMMNNGRYMLKKIKESSEIYQMLGNTWCRKKSSNLRAQHKSYQRESWSKILRCLSHDGLVENGKVQKPLLKERLKGFNAMFGEIHKTQSSWIVEDEQLRSELRLSVGGLVIPAYRSFVGRFSHNLTSGRQREKYIKYQPDDIESYIDDLFSSNPQITSRRK